MVVRNVTRFTVVLFFLSANISSQLAYAQAASTPAPYKNLGPITDYNSALKNSSDSNHARKGVRYNIQGQAPELGENSEQTLFDLPPSHTSKSLSAADFDTIIVGTVVAGQGYLSSDKRNIYSEFKVALQEVIKASASSLSVGQSVGQSIDIERSGGAIRLPSGKVLRRGSLADSMPLVGKRYIFLLQHKEDTDSFILKTGYQLEGDRVYCLDDNQKDTTLNQPLKEYGVTENQLIEQMKKSVSAGKGENSGTGSHSRFLF